MKVASENMLPCSENSVSPSLTLSVSLSWGEYCHAISKIYNNNGVDAYLVDIWLGASDAANKRLDKSRKLVHNVYPVKSVAKRALQFSMKLIVFLAFSVPGEFDALGLGPVIVRIGVCFQMCCSVCRSCV